MEAQLIPPNPVAVVSQVLKESQLVQDGNITIDEWEEFGDGEDRQIIDPPTAVLRATTSYGTGPGARSLLPVSHPYVGMYAYGKDGEQAWDVWGRVFGTLKFVEQRWVDYDTDKRALLHSILVVNLPDYGRDRHTRWPYLVGLYEVALSDYTITP